MLYFRILVQGYMQKLGIVVNELEVASETTEIIAQTIAESDYIFVGGGNTFFLLQELKRKISMTRLRLNYKHARIARQSPYGRINLV